MLTSIIAASRLRKRNPNFFMGNVAGFFDTFSKIQDIFTPEAVISSANVVNNDLELTIENFGIGSRGRRLFTDSNNRFTHFIDVDGRFVILDGSESTNGFYLQISLQYIKLNKLTRISQYCFRRVPCNLFYFPECTRIDALAFFQTNPNHIYIPKVNTIANNNVFFGSKSNTRIYINSSMVNNPQIQIAEDNGATIVEVMNFTSPISATIDSVSNISSTFATINFTQPAGSMNSINSYEVWLDDGTNNPEQIHTPYKQEIINSGDTITELKPNTKYTLKIATCDIYYNGSGMSENPSFSNEIVFSTLQND